MGSEPDKRIPEAAPPSSPLGDSPLAFLAEQGWQLSNVTRNAPRLVFGQHVGNFGVTLILAGIDISEGLLTSIEDLEAARNLLNGSSGREASHWG